MMKFVSTACKRTMVTAVFDVVWYCVATALCNGLLITAFAAEVEVTYAFRTDKTGGVAATTIDDQTGQFLRQRTLFESEEARFAKKVRRTSDGQTLILTNESEDLPYLFFVSLEQQGQQHGNSLLATVKMPSMPDEVAVYGNQALVTCDGDAIVAVNTVNRTIERTLNIDKSLSPPGNGPQGIMLNQDKTLAVISFQKDSRSGKKKGSRLLFLRLPSLEIVTDLMLPRDHPETHIATSPKDQGPGPELMFVDEANDVLAVSYDLYGSVALMSWKGALVGQIVGYQNIPTSLDDAWGTAFPDRGSLVSPFENPLLLVSNAGVGGGVTVIDMSQKKRIWNHATPPGLESPVYFPSLRTAFAVCPGKTKTRTETDIVKTFRPSKGLHVFRFQKANGDPKVQMAVLPTDDYLFQLKSIGTEDDPLCLIASGNADFAIMLRTFSPDRVRFLDEQPAQGKIQRFEK